jgi:hypothetical protein
VLYLADLSGGVGLSGEQVGGGRYAWRQPTDFVVYAAHTEQWMNAPLECMLHAQVVGVVTMCMIPPAMVSMIRTCGLAHTLWALSMSAGVWWALDVSGPGVQMLAMHARVLLGVEVVCMSLVLLTASLFPVCVLLCRTGAGCLTLVLLEVLLLGAWVVLDMLGFYVLFEATLMPAHERAELNPGQHQHVGDGGWHACGGREVGAPAAVGVEHGVDSHPGGAERAGAGGGAGHAAYRSKPEHRLLL